MAGRLALASLCICIGAGASPTGTHAPLIIVPGLTGSSMEARMKDAAMPHWECTTNTKGDWTTVWGSALMVLPREVDCMIAALTLTYDAATETYSNLPGVDLRPKGFGEFDDSDIVYRIEYFYLVKHLSGLGFKTGEDILIASYDWRLGLDGHSKRKNGVGGFFEKFKKLIEDTVQKRGKKAVVLSHSLGGPVVMGFFHTYVSEAWRAQYIESWVALSSPFTGAAVQMKAYVGGTTVGLPHWLVPHGYVKPVQVNASSALFMAPTDEGWGEKPILITPSRKYRAKDIEAVVTAIGPKAGGEQALAFMRNRFGGLKTVADWQRPPANVPMKIWYGTGTDTEESYEYHQDFSVGYEEAPAKINYGPGDGMVNLRSLQHAEMAWPRIPSAPVSIRTFPQATHFGVLSDSRVLRDLGEYLQELATKEETKFV